MKHILLTILLIVPSLCVLGFDVSNLITASNYQCLKNNGAKFAVVNAMRSNGTINVFATNNIRNAQQAFLPTDIYIQLCFSQNPYDQVNQLLSSIDSNLYSRVWIEVAFNSEGSCNWSTDQTKNC